MTISKIQTHTLENYPLNQGEDDVNIIKVQNKIYGDFAGKVDVSAKLLTIYLILAFYWQTMKHQPSVTCRYLSSKTSEKWKSLEN